MIKFEEENHVYRDTTNDQPCLSVTSFIHLFEPEKDWDKIAAAYAKKHKKDVNAVREEWRKKNEKAIERGNKFHKLREIEISSHNSINGLPIFAPYYEGGVKVSKTQKLEPGLYPELIVYLKSAGLCGQVDNPTITKDYVLNIDDYKTNEEIKKESFKNWEGQHEMMTGPFSNIMNCNFWHYTIQLNTYAYIIKKNNPKIKIGKLRILHIKFDQNDEVVSIEPIEVPLIQSDIRRAIEWYIKNKKK